MKLVATNVYFRSCKQQREQQCEGSPEASKKFEATSLQKLSDGAMEGESMPRNIIDVWFLSVENGHELMELVSTWCCVLCGRELRNLMLPHHNYVCYLVL
jgi:hypothetical protein